ncbi:MAG: stage V sporulation protein B [Peptococcaceae bacterium]|nr:stage V sporulation protein B [Peptococcaceae bacterium]
MAKTRLVYGAIILFAANLINRILGFIYQYLIMHFIGSEAYGLFHMVFPVYMTALVLSTAGIPLAISKMVAEKISLKRYQEAQRIFRTAFATLFVSGLVVSVVLFSNTSYIVSQFFADQRVYKVFQICIPAIFVVSISSAFRGYFQGLQNMMPSALSQIIEQITRVTIGFTLSLKLLTQGVEWAAAGLALGMLCGEITGLLSIGLQYLTQKRKKVQRNVANQEPAFSILGKLFTLSLPITGSRLVSTGLSSLEALIIPRQLQVAGYTSASATSLFGQLSGTAFTLLTFPSVFTFALATSLVPAISEAMVRHDITLARSRCSDAVRYTMLLGIPCVLLINYFAQPLTHLFNSSDVTVVLKILSLGGIFSYLTQTTTGILQGMGKTSIPLINALISGAIRVPLLFYLTGIPVWGLKGSAWAYVIGYVCFAVLNLAAIRREINFKFEFKAFLLQPLLAGLGMLVVIHLFSTLIPDKIAVQLFAIALGFLVYIIILIFIGVLKPEDLKKIPYLKRILG